MFWKSKKPEDVRKPEDPAWVLSVKKVGAREIISYLRDVPLQNREYLLVVDGRVEQQYNSQSRIDAMRASFGNYLVYEIDVSLKPIQMAFNDIQTASPDVHVDVTINGALKIESATDLFRSNIVAIEPEVSRYVEKIVRQACLRYSPRNFADAQREIDHQLTHMVFDFGVKLHNVIVVITPPKQVLARDEGVLTGTEVDEWSRDELRFNMQVEFFGQEYPYDISVTIGMELDGDPTTARERMRRKGISSPTKEVKSRAEQVIRKVLRKRNVSDIPDAEEDANNKLMGDDMKIDFGVRITHADVRVKMSEGEQLENKIDKIRVRIREIISMGPVMLRAEMAINPKLRDELASFIAGIRDDEAYQFTHELAKIKEYVDLKVIDPELLQNRVLGVAGDSISRVLGTSLHNPNNPNNQLTQGGTSSNQMLDAGMGWNDQPSDDAITIDGKARHSVSNLTGEKRRSIYDEPQELDED